VVIDVEKKGEGKGKNERWNANRVQFTYLADTKTSFPGSKKPYKGLADEKDRNDIIAYVSASLFSLPEQRKC
jgi:cytochrome c2